MAASSATRAIGLRQHARRLCDTARSSACGFASVRRSWWIDLTTSRTIRFAGRYFVLAIVKRIRIAANGRSTIQTIARHGIDARVTTRFASICHTGRIDLTTIGAILLAGRRPILAIVERVRISSGERPAAIRPIAGHCRSARVRLHLNLASVVFTTQITWRRFARCSTIACVKRIVIGKSSEFTTAMVPIGRTHAWIGGSSGRT